MQTFLTSIQEFPRVLSIWLSTEVPFIIVPLKYVVSNVVSRYFPSIVLVYPLTIRNMLFISKMRQNAMFSFVCSHFCYEQRWCICSMRFYGMGFKVVKFVFYCFVTISVLRCVCCPQYFYPFNGKSETSAINTVLL